MRTRWVTVVLFLSVLFAVGATAPRARASSDRQSGTSADSTTLAPSHADLLARHNPGMTIAVAPWITATVDPAGVGGAIAVDRADQVRISYYAATSAQGGVVRVARRAADAWQYEDSPQPGETLSFGAVTSLAIDAQGHDHVASIWYNWLTQQTYYTTNAGEAGWTAPTLLDAFYASPRSIAVAAGMDDNARITYCTQNEQTLATELWYVEMLADGTIGFQGQIGNEGCWFGTSLVVGDTDVPQVAYYSQENGAEAGILKYATRVDGAWQIETVDDTGNAGFSVSLALDRDGTPHIGYLYRAPDGGGGRLDVRHAARAGGVWQVDTAATIPAGQGSTVGTSLALDALGRPQIVYFDQTAGAIVYSWYAEGRWQRGHIILDDSVQLITARALVLDGSGVPHLTYDTVGGQIYATGELPEPTALDLVGVSVVRAGQETTVGWRTGVERNTFGFHLWRAGTALRADAVRITSQMIMATGSGSSYVFVDAGVTVDEENTYWLQEVETTGRTVDYGPYLVNPAWPDRAPMQQTVYLPLMHSRQ